MFGSMMAVLQIIRYKKRNSGCCSRTNVAGMKGDRPAAHACGQGCSSD